MADSRNSTEVLLASTAVTATGSLDVPGLKDSCTCSQGRFETASMDDRAARRAMASFAPQDLASISQFLRLRDTLMDPQPITA